MLYDPTGTQVVIAIDFLEGRYRCHRGWFATEIAHDQGGRAAAHHGSKTMVPYQLSIMAAVIVRSIQDNRLLNHARLCCIGRSPGEAAKRPELQDALPVGAMQEPDDGRIWQSSAIDPLASIDLSRLLARRACRCPTR